MLQFLVVDPVVMLATGVTSTGGVLPVLADPTMTVGDVPSQLSAVPLSSDLGER